MENLLKLRKRKTVTIEVDDRDPTLHMALFL